MTQLSIRSLLSLTSAATIFAVAAPAMAQDTNASDIVVTAQRMNADRGDPRRQRRGARRQARR